MKEKFISNAISILGQLVFSAFNRRQLPAMSTAKHCIEILHLLNNL